MIGEYLEKVGAAIAGPVEQVHEALAGENQKDENGNVLLTPEYLIGGTAVVAIGALYLASKTGLVKPAWVTKYKVRRARRTYRKPVARRRRYYRRRK
jgi:hypothetical protein